MELSGLAPFPDEFAARYRARGYWRDRPLGLTFHELFEKHAAREAMIFEEHRVTYGELDQRVDRLAQHLVYLGYKPLDVVIMQIPNSDDFVYLYFAFLRAGVTPLMALPAHREHEIGHYLDFTQAKGYAVADRLGKFDMLQFAKNMRDAHAELKHIFVSGPVGETENCFSIAEMLLENPPATVDLDALPVRADLPAVFQLSGGTTGVPKIIPRSHNDYDFCSRSVSQWCGMNSDTVLLVAAPAAHNFTLATPGIMGTFYGAGKVVISPTARPDHAIPLIGAEGVTQLEGTPAMYVSWIEHELAASTDLTSVLVMRSGGQKCQAELKRRIENVFTNGKVTEGFGMGEGLIMWTRVDDPDEVRLNTVGRPWCEDDEIRVVDDEYLDVEDGVTGQLLVRGPYTLRGYYNAPEANKTAFTPDGFLCTGDLVTRLHNGYFTVDGRIKDLVNRGGEKISTEEIENFILALPQVSNVSCVAVPDQQMGERMCACVTLSSDSEPLALDDISEFLNSHGIARFKFPEYLLIFDEFPISPFGKVAKRTLATVATERLDLTVPTT